MDHGKKKSETSKQGAPIGTIIASLAIGAVIGSAVTYSVSKPEPAPTTQSTSSPSSPSFGGAPQTMTLPPQGQQFTPMPQPPGEAPPGKVWSPEHGHWHDIPGGLSIPSPTPSTPAPAPAPGTNN